jgi:hypothetical protein
MIVFIASSRLMYFGNIEDACLLIWFSVEILYIIICYCLSVCLWTYIHALNYIVNYPAINKNGTGWFLLIFVVF